jgi:L-ascorbate metabolism protein UlaG (beta-lactamase superfamily)
MTDAVLVPDAPPATAGGGGADGLTYVGHGTVLLRIAGAHLLTDPALLRWLGPLRRAAAAPAVKAVLPADVVLISHLHIDHLDVRSLKLLARHTPVLVPRHGAKILSRLGFTEIVPVVPGDTLTVGRARLTVTVAAHPGKRYPMGAEGESVGYVVEGPPRVYFAGDTGVFPEMAAIAGGLDLALLPVSGWGPTMDEHHLGPHEAAESLRLLRPRLAVPIHWGTFYPPGLPARYRRHMALAAQEFATHAQKVAPEVAVRILKPMESTPLA